MSYLHCPYCEVKGKSKIKTVYKASQPIDGKCPDCGARIDAGQHSIKVNGYADIYAGAISLMDDMVETFNRILYDCNIDLKDDYGEEVEVRFSTSEIIERLFLPYVGGTSKSNFAEALGIDEDEHTWIISKDGDKCED